MIPHYPSFVAFAGISAVLCVHAICAAEPPLPAPAPALTELEAAAPKDWKDSAAIAANHARVIALIETNTLQSGEDYRRAATLVQMNLGEYRIGRLHYELLLTAAAKGDAQAEKQLFSSYDTLMGLLSRPTRFDSGAWAKATPEYFEFEAAPACVLPVWHDPAAARAAVAGLADNPEIKTIVDADQADRRGDWNNRTPEEREATTQRDKVRNARMLAIIAAGDIRTANDFSRTSLVMQHSARFPGYRVAHELAVASLLLGDRGSGRWLVTATYDRMLRSVGLDQRFGTQLGPDGPLRVDETGICDNERSALGCPTLAEARNRARSRQTQAKRVTIEPSIVVDGNRLNDPAHHVSAIYPDGWKVIRSVQVDLDSTSVRFAIAKHPEATALFYYQMKAPPVAAADPQAKLREQADAKQADRRTSLTDYRNRPDSFQFRRVDEQASLRNLADFSRDGAPWCEYLVRTLGNDCHALIAVQAPAEEIGGLQAEIDAMAATVRLP